MFIDNKYTKLYYSIINRAKERGELTLYEVHHIIPRSFGGSDENSNLVKLTFREHYICHRLLTKMCIGEYKHKMTFALHTFFHFNKHRRLDFTSHQYEYHKRCFVEACANREPFYKSDIFKFKHRKTGEEFVGTRREFIRHTGISEQSANFLFNNAIVWYNSIRWIKDWGIWVEEAKDWSFNKKMQIKNPAPKVQCEHCHKIVSQQNYKRWHGAKCKMIDIQGHYDRTRQVASINAS